MRRNFLALGVLVSLCSQVHRASYRQLRWETFNTFNPTNPICCGSTSFVSTLFNTATSTRDPRIMQLGLKMNF